MTDAELAAVKASADAAGITAAEWARRRILAEAPVKAKATGKTGRAARRPR